MISVQGSECATSSGRIGGKAFYTKCPTQSFWFQKFNLGCLKRMGQIVKKDLAISIDILLHMLKIIKTDIGKVSLRLVHIPVFVFVALSEATRCF